MSDSSSNPKPLVEDNEFVAAPLSDAPKRDENLLLSRLSQEMTSAWMRGDRRPVEYYLSRDDDLADDVESAVGLIYEEFCLRRELGEAPPPEEFFARFPEWRDELEVLFRCDELIEAEHARPAFLEVGETLGEFQLLSELGRGGLGRVYLARQPLLGDRLVVLKVTPLDGTEHLALSRLQHTHIAPLYCIQDEPNRNLRAFCMPYVGGATLAQILKSLDDKHPKERAGKHILDALERLRPEPVVENLPVGRAWNFLKKESYTRAVCWIAACVADALAYMHERGLLHMDVKPSNLLIAADGQPMLIDFHLAHAPMKAGSKTVGRIGGTARYMSPEQRTALQAIGDRRAIPSDVDRRSDIYSLGLILYEALSGLAPNDKEESPTPLNQLNSQVSVGLAAIVHKCLAMRPQDRYADAESLARDLRRHLADLPLREAGNRSLVERWQKLRRRRPYVPLLLPSLLALLVALLTAGIFGWSSIRQQFASAESSLVESRQLRNSGQYEHAADSLQRGLYSIDGLPGNASLREQLAEELDAVRQYERAEKLHRVVDSLRMLEGLEGIANDELRRLYENCQAIWQQRDQFRHEQLEALEIESWKTVRNDLLDLGILSANLRGRIEGDETAHSEALRILDETERLFGSTAVLQMQRQFHAERLGKHDVAEQAAIFAAETTPRNAWEHHALGRWLMSGGNLEQAREQFRLAGELEPQSFWPSFYDAVCAYRMKQYDDAIIALRVCLAIEPQRPEIYYNRALVFAAQGRRQDALGDLQRALALDPDFSLAQQKRTELLPSGP